MSSDSSESSGDVVRELHSDLFHKYKRHGDKIKSIWMSFAQKEREKCLRAGAADGVVLKHPQDISLGNVYKMIPEWNVRDITKPGSNFLLKLLEFRATFSLRDQVAAGFDGNLGDLDFIQLMINTKRLRHVDSFKDCFTLFIEDETYGSSCKINSHHQEVRKDLSILFQSGSCVPQSTGELILQRQIFLLQSLNIIIDDILEEGSLTRNRQTRQKKSDKAVADALSKLSFQDSSTCPGPSSKPTLSDLINTAHEQRDSLQEYVDLCFTEPVVLCHAVNIGFFSRPDLVADEKGRQLSVCFDKYISGAFFEVIHSAVKGAAIWSYMSRLLEKLNDLAAADKLHRNIVLQEIANVSHLEYTRARGLFVRQIQSGTGGAKWFKRLAGKFDSFGNASVAMKGKPEDLTVTDPQLHYVLRLCHPDTTAATSVDWIKKLSDLHRSHPLDRDRLEEREIDALGDLVVIVGFIFELSRYISMPSVSRRNGQMFVARSHELEAELSHLKGQADLRAWVVPIDNLLEPGVAAGAMEALGQFVVDKTGSTFGFLYQDLVEECFIDLGNQFEHAQAMLKEKSNWTPLPIPPQEPLDTRIAQRKEKEKTRPPHSSLYEIVSIAPRSTDEESTSGPALPSQTFTVRASTVDVFSALFDKSQSRGSISWAAFQAALVDLGFAIIPKFGSVYTFSPPESMGFNKSFTVHRPHAMQIEGHRTLMYARRLKRLYNWDANSFRTK